MISLNKILIFSLMFFTLPLFAGEPLKITLQSLVDAPVVRLQILDPTGNPEFDSFFTDPDGIEPGWFYEHTRELRGQYTVKIVDPNQFWCSELGTGAATPIAELTKEVLLDVEVSENQCKLSYPGGSQPPVCPGDPDCPSPVNVTLNFFVHGVSEDNTAEFSVHQYDSANRSVGEVERYPFKENSWPESFVQEMNINYAYANIKLSVDGATPLNCHFADQSAVVDIATVDIVVDLIAGSSCQLYEDFNGDFPGAVFITSCKELADKITSDPDGYYILAPNGLDPTSLHCEDAGVFTPIAKDFTGTLTSKNKVNIKNLTIKGNASYGGLFQTIKGATITNLNFLDSVVITPETANRGLIAGVAIDSEISHISIDTLSVFHDDDMDDEEKNPGATGAVIGTAHNTQLFNVHVYGEEEDAIQIQKKQYAGGLIGTATDTIIKNSSVQALQSIDSHNCYQDKSCAFGGLIGLIDGENLTTIEQSFATGKIDTKQNSGGLVGLIEVQAPVNILNSYAMVDLLCDSKCKYYAGGLIGQAKEIANSTDYAHVTLQQVYAAGKVKPSGENGGKGIVGAIKDAKTHRVKACRDEDENSYCSFFDKGATGKDNGGDYYSEGVSTSAMKDAATFKGWNTDIWYFADKEYPSLK